jgi:uncharacterized protein (TIGR02145 family)
MKNLTITLILMILTSTILLAQENIPKQIAEKENKENKQTMLDVAPNIKNNPNATTFTDDLFDHQFDFPCGDASGEAGIETNGDYIYTSKWNGDGFCCYEMDGTFIGWFPVAGEAAVRDMAYDGNYFYGAAASTQLYEMDFVGQSGTLISTLTAAVATRACAYDAEYDGFWANNWSTDITLYDRTGSILNSFPCGAHSSYYGFASNNDEGNPWLYGFAQSGGVNSCDIVQIDTETGAETGIVFDAIEYSSSGTGIAGGLAIFDNYSPIAMTLLGIIQNETIFGVEGGSHYHPAVIEYNPTFFNQSVPINDTMQDFLIIHSASCGTLEWNIEIIYINKFENKKTLKESNFSKENWLSVDPNAGVLPTGATEIVTLTFNAVNLEEGIYYAEIHILSNCVNNPEVIIPVTMTVVSSVGIQVFDLVSGFQFISSAFAPTDPNLLIVMEDILNENLDFVRNSQGQTLRKIGPNWVNGIGDWIIEEGYLIKMFSDDSFSIEGEMIDPGTQISLFEGYQLVSYFPLEQIDAIMAFESIISDDLDFIRNSQGQILRKIGPYWINGIGDCQPGEGYLIKMFADNILIYPSAFTCGDTFVDPRNEQIYTTVQIGNQCWMAENLNIGEMINGSEEMTDNGIIEKYCYDNNTANCVEYGGLYQWDEMMEYYTTTGVQGICPSDWHLPTDGEWEIVAVYLGGLQIAGGKMKEIGTTHWNPPNTAATNESGFTGLPGGYNYGESYSYMGYSGSWWSSTESTSNSAYKSLMFYRHGNLVPSTTGKIYGFSVRCIRNNRLFDNLSNRTKGQSHDLSDLKVKNIENDYFTCKRGNPAEPVYTIYFDGLNIGDEVAVFDGEILAGVGLVKSENIFENAIPVFSNLYKTGNKPIIKVWNKSENAEYVLNNYTFSNPYGDAWTENVFPAEDGEYSLLNLSTTGISDEHVRNEISIYPNPTTGIITIGNLARTGQVWSIEITDITGKIVFLSFPEIG